MLSKGEGVAIDLGTVKHAHLGRRPRPGARGAFRDRGRRRNRRGDRHRRGGRRARGQGAQGHQGHPPAARRRDRRPRRHRGDAARLPARRSARCAGRSNGGRWCACRAARPGWSGDRSVAGALGTRRPRLRRRTHRRAGRGGRGGGLRPRRRRTGGFAWWTSAAGRPRSPRWRAGARCARRPCAWRERDGRRRSSARCESGLSLIIGRAGAARQLKSEARPHRWSQDGWADTLIGLDAARAGRRAQRRCRATWWRAAIEPVVSAIGTAVHNVLSDIPARALAADVVHGDVRVFRRRRPAARPRGIAATGEVTGHRRGGRRRPAALRGPRCRGDARAAAAHPRVFAISLRAGCANAGRPRISGALSKTEACRAGLPCGTGIVAVDSAGDRALGERRPPDGKARSA